MNEGAKAARIEIFYVSLYSMISLQLQLVVTPPFIFCLFKTSYMEIME